MSARQPELRSMSPRAGEIIAAARRLLEAEGPEALTMRRLGDELGMRAPSIYKHLPNKRAVEVALIELALAEMGEASHRAISCAAGPGAGGAIAELLRTYREHAVTHPNLYRLATAGRLPRDELTPGLEEWSGEPWFAVTGDPFLAQALWSFAHGMVILELDQRYPDGSELDRTWTAGAAAFASAGRRP